MYYTIGEVAELFEVNTSLIRHWEKEFKTLKPKKNKKGNRLFSPKEIMKIDQIYNLVKGDGYTLEGAKQALKKKSPEVSETLQPVQEFNIIERLELIKSKLLALKTARTKLLKLPGSIGLQRFDQQQIPQYLLIKSIAIVR